MRVCYFPIDILGQMWYLVVSLPALCPLSHFVRVCSSPSDFKNINERRGIKHAASLVLSASTYTCIRGVLRMFNTYQNLVHCFARKCYHKVIVVYSQQQNKFFLVAIYDKSSLQISVFFFYLQAERLYDI